MYLTAPEAFLSFLKHPFSFLLFIKLPYAFYVLYRAILGLHKSTVSPKQRNSNETKRICISGKPN